MTDKNEKARDDDGPDVGTHVDQGAGREQTTELGGSPGDDKGVGDSAASGFTKEQLAQLEDMFGSQEPSGFGGWLDRRRDRRQERRALRAAAMAAFVRKASPPDEEMDFDQETFTGWLAVRAAKHRGVTAVAAVVAILVLGGLWVMILGGGLALPVAAMIAVALLGAGLVLGLLFRRRRR